MTTHHATRLPQARMSSTAHARSIAVTVFRFILPTVWAVMILIPIAFMVFGSLRTRQEYALDPRGLPSDPQFANYATAWIDANLATAYVNNIVVTVAAVLGVIALGSLAAYGIARSAGPFSAAGYAYFALGLIVPFQLGLPALYKMAVRVGLVDNLFGVVLVHIGTQLPLAVFLYSGFLATIPLELEESARVDGAGTFRVFRSIVFPLLEPVHATVVVLTSIAIWNDLIVSLFFLQSEGNLTLSRTTLSFMSLYNSNIPVIYASGVIVVLPILVLFFVMQRYLVAGITQGALKG